LGAGVLALMMFLTVADVCLRMFDKPILGTYEMTEYMMAMLVAFTIAYCAINRGHVNVDLVTTRIPERPRAILSIFTNLICVIFFSLITWKSFGQAVILLGSGSVSPALLIPVFPFVYIISIGFGLLSLVFILQLFESISKALGKWTH
jgi:TRAP-type C4-dicarboxylate transport system permease small subunit